MVQECKIDKFGVSVYTTNDVEKCLQYSEIKVIQIPFNLLDSRLIDTGLLQRAKDKNIEIHARSVYLQGLLLMDANSIPKKLQDVIPKIEEIEQICEKLGLTKKQLAFCYVRDNPLIDRFFIGCESLSQVQESIELNMMPRLSENDINYILNKFKNTDERILNPSLW